MGCPKPAPEAGDFPARDGHVLVTIEAYAVPPVFVWGAIHRCTAKHRPLGKFHQDVRGTDLDHAIAVAVLDDRARRDHKAARSGDNHVI